MKNVSQFSEENVCSDRDYQRLTKPLIEKRRRARINLCLMQLKEMIIDSGRHKIVNPKCKYEKADILELTVDYIQNLHQKQKIEKNETKKSYTSGYVECAKQVEHFIKYLPLTDNNNTIENPDQLSKKLVSHLENYYRLELNSNFDDNNNMNIDSQPIDLSISSDDMENNDINHSMHTRSRSTSSLSVIHHTSEYSGSPSRPSTVSPAPSPDLTQSLNLCSPFATELDVRPQTFGLYGNRRNGHMYQVVDIDGMWRPW